jgi:hypothetical protein
LKKTAVKDLIPGMIVNRDVLSGDGIVLLEKGTRLTAWQIANLRNWPISHIYIADDPPAAPDATPAASFYGEYVRTIDAIRHAFEHIRIFREVPVLRMEELAEERIPLLAETVGVLDYYNEIRLHSQHTLPALAQLSPSSPPSSAAGRNTRASNSKNLILSASSTTSANCSCRCPFSINPAPYTPPNSPSSRNTPRRLHTSRKRPAGRRKRQKRPSSSTTNASHGSG